MDILKELKQYSGNPPQKYIVSNFNPAESIKKRQINSLNDKLQTNILISGATGSGKEFLASRIAHKYGIKIPEKQSINCAGLSPNIARAELFGYVPKSYTGGNPKGKKSIFQTDSIVFLDELHCLPLEIQATLLRLIEYGELQPFGGQPESLEKPPIIIAAMQPHRKKDILPDLLNRFDFCQVILPLNHKPDIIPKLVALFLYDCFVDKNICENPKIKRDSLLALLFSEWKGNIRELKNVIKNSLIFGDVVYPIHSNNKIIVDSKNKNPIYFYDKYYNENRFDTNLLEELLKKFAKKRGKDKQLLSLSDLWNFDIRSNTKLHFMGDYCLSDFYEARRDEKEKEKKEIKLKERAKYAAEFIVQRDIYVQDIEKGKGITTKKTKKPKTVKELDKIIEKYGTMDAAAKQYFNRHPGTVSRWHTELIQQETK